MPKLVLPSVLRTQRGMKLKGVVYVRGDFCLSVRTTQDMFCKIPNIIKDTTGNKKSKH